MQDRPDTESEIVEAWKHPLPGKRNVALGHDVIAFLIVAPALGSLLASLGAWGVLLLIGPLFAIVGSIVIGGIPAVSALVTARCVRNGYIKLPLVVGLAGGVGMFATLSIGPQSLLSTNFAWSLVCVGIAFLCAEGAFQLARVFASAPIWASFMLVFAIMFLAVSMLAAFWGLG